MIVLAFDISRPFFIDSSAHQNIELTRREVQHDPLELIFRHLAVGDSDAGLRHKFLQTLRQRLDALNPIVYEEYLPTSVHFAENGFAYKRLIPASNKRANW